MNLPTRTSTRRFRRCDDSSLLTSRRVARVAVPRRPTTRPRLGQGSLDHAGLSTKPEVADEFVFSDPAVWKYGKDENGKGFLELDYDRKNVQEHLHPEAPHRRSTSRS